MQCPDKILCQWYILNCGFLFHHPQTNITCCHFLNVAHIGLADYFAEQQQDFCLPIS